MPTAILKTLCGCEKQLKVPQLNPRIQVPIYTGRSLYWHDCDYEGPSAPSCAVRTFELYFIRPESEHIETVGEYREVWDR